MLYYAVVERLLKKAATKPVKMLGCALTLGRYSSAAQSEDSGSSAVPGCCVVVFGVAGDIDVEEELVPRLENKRKGGGPVKKTERLGQTEDSVLITFHDQSSMKLLLIIIIVPCEL